MKKHECDKTPYQFQSVKMEQRWEGNYTGWYLSVGDCETEITYCPYCGEELLLILTANRGNSYENDKRRSLQKLWSYFA